MRVPEGRRSRPRRRDARRRPGDGAPAVPGDVPPAPWSTSRSRSRARRARSTPPPTAPAASTSRPAAARRYALRLTQPLARAARRRVSGGRAERDQRRPRPGQLAGSGPGRMYVLDPWDRRTSRAGGRPSTRSGASRSWTSERRTPRARARPTTRWAGSRSRSTASGTARSRGVSVGRGRRRPGARRGARRGRARRRRGPRRARRRSAGGEGAPVRGAYGDPRRAPARPRTRARAGARRTDDRVVVVDFEPERTPAERIDAALRVRERRCARSGILRPRVHARDRLRERDRGAGRVREAAAPGSRSRSSLTRPRRPRAGGARRARRRRPASRRAAADGARAAGAARQLSTMRAPLGGHGLAAVDGAEQRARDRGVGVGVAAAARPCATTPSSTPRRVQQLVERVLQRDRAPSPGSRRRTRGAPRVGRRERLHHRRLRPRARAPRRAPRS